MCEVPLCALSLHSSHGIALQWREGIIAHQANRTPSPSRTFAKKRGGLFSQAGCLTRHMHNRIS